jgi:hypothetical protein
MMLAPLARELLYFYFLSNSFFFGMLIFFCISSSEEEGEEEEPAVLGMAPTSTSNTMVLSEEHRTAAEYSPPPQHNTETSTPLASPRAPSPKRAKTGAGDTHEIVAGSSSTPFLDDISPFSFACYCVPLVYFSLSVDVC